MSCYRPTSYNLIGLNVLPSYNLMNIADNLVGKPNIMLPTWVGGEGVGLSRNRGNFLLFNHIINNE